jgi:sarcosine/dimethylglycine N-methyltransferase
MRASQGQAVERARDYYNSSDADNFYCLVWGGEDIHIGIYEHDDEPIADASRRTVERMAETLDTPGTDAHLLDIGAGYGGAARYLAGRFGCRVSALNLSETENERHRALNRAAGLDGLIDVVDGNFENLPFPSHSFDAVWSEDAILHSARRDAVVGEVARVLRPGGDFVFTDPMQSDDCPTGVLGPVLERIHLESLGSPGWYAKVAAQNGLSLKRFSDLTPQLINHYRRVHDELLARRPVLRGKVSDEYIRRMLRGLRHWVEAGRKGYLCWGILHFRKAH